MFYINDEIDCEIPCIPLCCPDEGNTKYHGIIRDNLALICNNTGSPVNVNAIMKLFRAFQLFA